ncbi:503_t:CDS:1 [Paraglomus occultum]|uniref:503_t:CDS:1 n=1 Tax=Paraglomus occultum TaxID=144539 RepID=A0A9N9GZW6_9GLOM|nr:503_t:CDS:1 [Paraglomus occultum]
MDIMEHYTKRNGKYYCKLCNNNQKPIAANKLHDHITKLHPANDSITASSVAQSSNIAVHPQHNEVLTTNSLTVTSGIKLRDLWTEDGLDLKNKKDLTQPITYRKRTTQWIIENVKDDHIMLIRGPRYSGKTSMCELLERHLEEIITVNDQAVSISNISFMVNSDITYEDYWKIQTGRTYWEWQRSLQNGQVYIIMDETQITYSGSKFAQFWNWVRGEQMNKDTNLRLIMFAVYPIDSERGDIDMDPAPITASPIDLLHKYGVRLLMSSANEHNELMDDFSRKFGWKEAMTENVKDAIVNLVSLRSEDMNTKSCHLGLIRRILHYIYDCHDPSYNVPPPTEVVILKYLVSSELFEHVKRHRGASHLYRFNREEEKILREVLQKDFIKTNPSSDNHETVASLCKAGYLHFIDKGRMQNFIVDSGRVGFLTNYTFIMCFTKLSQGKKNPIVIKDDQFENFLVESIKRLDPDIVENSLGILSRQDGSRLLAERSWQMEFYQAAYSCLPEEYFISPDVGATFGTPGRLDFYINTGLNWAVELAAEGDDIPGHVERFEQENKYKNIDQSRNIVLDFRMGTDIRKVVPGAWHLLYDKLSHAFTIKRSDGEDQIIELSKCKFGFTIGDGDEIEKLIQDAQTKKAKADIERAEADIMEANVRKRKLKIEEEELDVRNRKLKIETLNGKIEYWTKQGAMDKVAKFRNDLDELMDD